MKALTRILVLLLVVLVPTGAAMADWYDDYDAGIKAAQNGDWDTVIAKMNAAIAKESKENKRARTYGNIFIQYHPYYYRGYAYMQKGIPCNSQAALTSLQNGMADLKSTSGPGKVSFGEASSLIIRLNEMITACGLTNTPAPAPPPGPVVTTPRVDPNLEPAKRRAQAALDAALSKLTEAQGAQASRFAPSQFSTATKLLNDANSLNVSASTTADFNNVADAAERAKRAFDAAISAARIQAAQAPTPTPTPTPPVTMPAPTPGPGNGTLNTGGGSSSGGRTTGNEVIRPIRQELKEALGEYFDGKFKDSAGRFQQLASQQSNNAMIWAFLGAARYYDYYLGGQTNASTLEAAKDALRQARKINPNLKLDAKYFSPRFRDFYATQMTDDR